MALRGGWGRGRVVEEGRGLDFKLNLMPEARVVGVKTNPPRSSQMLLFSQLFKWKSEKSASFELLMSLSCAECGDEML